MPTHSNVNFDYQTCFNSAAAPESGLGRVRIAEVRVPSGQLTIGDAANWVFEEERLTVDVPAGAHPIDVVVADGVPALVRVNLGEGTPVRWVPALGLNEVAEPVGIPVDGGLLSLVDHEGAQALGERWDPADMHPLDNPMIQDLDALTDRMAVNEDQWAEWWFEPGHPFAMMTVRSGYGDGYYVPYWGEDAEGRRTALVVDFSVLTANTDAP